MEFDSFTVVLLLHHMDAPPMDEAALDRLQDAHLDHLARLHEAGQLLAAGPSPGTGDRRVRGVCLFRGTPDEALAIEAKDPAVVAGRFALEACAWLVPRGAMHFARTRFPHSSAEAGGP